MKLTELKLLVTLKYLMRSWRVCLGDHGIVGGFLGIRFAGFDDIELRLIP
jgi:hypothetical protein